VRARCELLYETGLRPTTVDALSVPEHWEPGAKVLTITAAIDKEGYSREVPLTTRAMAILRRCAPDQGVVFGRHRYDHFVYLPDSSLGIAPADPGTEEGGVRKPQHPDDRLNKWCVRACERCVIAERAAARAVTQLVDCLGVLLPLPDFGDLA